MYIVLHHTFNILSTSKIAEKDLKDLGNFILFWGSTLKIGKSFEQNDAHHC